MALPIDALIEPLTEDQVKATIYDLLAAVGVGARSWKSGGTARTIIAVLAKVIAGFTVLIALAIRGMFRSTAEGVWLTLLARYVYAVERITATFAAGGVTLTNAGGGIYSLEARELSLLNTTTGKVYRNTAAFDLGALQTLTITVEAVEAGSESTATSGQIDDFVTPLLGVTCTNESALVGTDEQDDASLRADCLSALGALSPYGANGAYEYFAKRVPGGGPLTDADGTIIAVNRVQVVATSLTGNVSVWVASANGELSTDELELVRANVRRYAAPATATALVGNADPVPVAVYYTAYADAAAGITASDLKDAIDLKLTEYFATYPIGGTKKSGTQKYLYLGKVKGLIEAADPAVLEVDFFTPIADVALDDGDFAELTISGSSSVVLVTQ